MDQGGYGGVMGADALFVCMRVWRPGKGFGNVLGIECCTQIERIETYLMLQLSLCGLVIYPSRLRDPET